MCPTLTVWDGWGAPRTFRSKHYRGMFRGWAAELIRAKQKSGARSGMSLPASCTAMAPIFRFTRFGAYVVCLSPYHVSPMVTGTILVAMRPVSA